MEATETFNPHRTGSSTMWDHFHLHHVLTDGNKVVHFETGEMVVTFRFCGRTGPDDYRFYRDRNITITSTTAPDFTSMLKQQGIGLARPGDKTPVPASWLQKKADGFTDAQTLVIDHDHNVAVNMTPMSGVGSGAKDPRQNWLDRKPRHIQRVPGVYYPNRESAPEGYATRVTRPYKMDADEKAHLDSLTRACKAWWQMSGWAEYVASRSPHAAWRRLNETSSGRPGIDTITFRQSLQMVRWAEIKGRAFEDLKPTTVYRMIENGVTTERTTSLYTHLDVVPLT